MDMAVQVVYCTQNPDGDYNVQGIWFNMGQKRSYLVNITCEFVIKKHQLRNWNKIVGSISDFIRDDEWEKLQ